MWSGIRKRPWTRGALNLALRVIEPAPGLLLYGDLSHLRALESMVAER